MKILDEGYYDLILNKTLAPNYADGDSITYINQRHSLIHIPVANNICALGTMPYHIFPSLFEATSPISLGTAGIISIQENPYLDLRGQGVLVGVVDTGVDYTHPAFLNQIGRAHV